MRLGITFDELLDKYDDEHLVHFCAVDLIDQGAKSKETQQREMLKTLGFKH